METQMLRSHYMEVDGHDIHYLSNVERVNNTSTNPLVLFLHGFPENAHAWEPLISCLPEGVDVIAPDLPGYHKSAPLGQEEDYAVPMLLARMATFIEEVSNKRRVVLVGHDWGGVIAWPLAAFHSHLFSHLIILNAAHPSTFTELLKTSCKQREKSQYIHQLIDDDAQSTLQSTDFTLLKNMLGELLFSTHKGYADTLLAMWNNKRSLSAMLNYYRNMPQLVPVTDADEHELKRIRVPNIRILIPTLVLWGEQDDAFDVDILDGLPRYVDSLTIKRHELATHWIHREQATWAAKHICDFIWNRE
ncbi:epoxide hydrolase EphM [Alteromonas sp. MTD1]|uniref:alpha/beta fold hydrolase n=1 Tax=Alteromonas sp. MTD1 TaxID=3057962 RepID=UPI0036F3EF93